MGEIFANDEADSDLISKIYKYLQVALVLKNSPANAGDTRDMNLTPGSGRSPGIGNGNSLQYS